MVLPGWGDVEGGPGPGPRLSGRGKGGKRRGRPDLGLCSGLERGRGGVTVPPRGTTDCTSLPPGLRSRWAFRRLRLRLRTSGVDSDSDSEPPESTPTPTPESTPSLYKLKPLSQTVSLGQWLYLKVPSPLKCSAFLLQIYDEEEYNWASALHGESKPIPPIFASRQNQVGGL